MGLAGPKNRTKLSKDPNNTHWSNETDRFGHKILRGLGWTPGSTLGAKDANHADHYTAASTSHIRVFLKDDNLGLGARRGKADEQFGLNIFQNLLGRLNGKSDVELKQEEDKQRDVQLKQFQSQRFGTMHFVSGGFLVGDKIEKLLALTKKEEGVKQEEFETVDSTAPGAGSKKRKRGVATEVKKEEDEEKVYIKSESPEAASEAAVQTSTKAEVSRPSKKSKKTEQADGSEAEADESTSASVGATKEERRKLKAERRARKEARRLKREEKQKRKELRKSKVSSEASGAETKKSAETITPAEFTNGRHIVRQRYIRQKKMAYSDEKALKEIFMIKAPG